jgi:hypothetical protein
MSKINNAEMIDPAFDRAEVLATLPEVIDAPASHRSSQAGRPSQESGMPGCSFQLGGTSTQCRLEIKAHPHMLRYACGYALANQGTDTPTLQAYLGHRSISNTVPYTELAPGRFKGLWTERERVGSRSPT